MPQRGDVAVPAAQHAADRDLLHALGHQERHAHVERPGDFAPEEREWKGHLTLGRVKEGGTAADVLAPHRDKDFGITTVNEVVIYESKTRPQGAEYTPLARVALGARSDIVWPESEPWQPGRGPREQSPETDAE